jgi:hypothetical protein
MTANLLQRPLRLTLHASDALPDGMSWKILVGYVIATTWSGDGDVISLGIWSPGNLISSEQPAITPLELHCLTTVVVEKIELSTIEQRKLLDRERKMLAELLAIQRIRLADARLIRLLQWIARSFGQVNSHGCRLSLTELNLTHRQLAELCCLTRVTVTKILSRFRLGGQMLAVGESDLLIPSLP